MSQCFLIPKYRRRKINENSWWDYIISQHRVSLIRHCVIGLKLLFNYLYILGHLRLSKGCYTERSVKLWLHTRQASLSILDRMKFQLRILGRYLRCIIKVISVEIPINGITYLFLMKKVFTVNLKLTTLFLFSHSREKNNK